MRPPVEGEEDDAGAREHAAENPARHRRDAGEICGGEKREPAERGERGERHDALPVREQAAAETRDE